MDLIGQFDGFYGILNGLSVFSGIFWDSFDIFGRFHGFHGILDGSN